jgi:MinD-like ATPase involved in chromosome partitioning or flagellar assembly
MLVACWSVKGGSGTTVVSVALAAVLARSSPRGALVADLCGDVPAVLGIPDPGGPGIVGWLAAGTTVPADGLGRLEVDAGPGLRLLPAGEAPVTSGPDAAVGGWAARAAVLGGLLAADSRPVVADCGASADAVGLAVVAAATTSLLVLRPCYLALRRALRAPTAPTGVVLVREAGRALGRADVEQVLGVPVVAEVPVDPAVARAVDAGVLGTRLPRALSRSLRHVA